MAFDQLKRTSTFSMMQNIHVRPPLTTDNYHLGIERSQQVTTNMIRRLDLLTDLKAHQGCVNCLEWSEDGRLLASGSDDCYAIVWDPHRRRSLTRIPTGHTGNIFSVNFLPHSGNASLVSGAADSRVILHDVTQSRPVLVYQCHSNRVKRLATARDSAFLFWSASEDGTVRQFDLRERDTGPQSRNVLVDLNCLLSQSPEAKCLSVNPCRSEMLAVGANDHCVRLFDRRKLSLIRAAQRGGATSAGMTSEIPLEDGDPPDRQAYGNSAQYFIPGHLTRNPRPKRPVAITYVAFSPDGRDLVANLGGEQVYTVSAVPGCRQQAVLAFRCPDLGATGSKRRPLPEAAQTLKARANEELEQGQLNASVRLYCEALALAPGDPVLLGNRAAALLKRRWDGDAYAAAVDCQAALSADPGYHKAMYRLARAFADLGWTPEAKRCSEEFAQRFPEHTGSSAYRTLVESLALPSEAPPRQPGSGSASSARLLRSSEPPQLCEEELLLRSRALDLRQRFVGHCNTTTDIKEANFFGRDFLMAGSDDGNFFVWDRRTEMLQRVIKGDDSIVNCLQPHPTSCLLATCGIDPVVRLWSPGPERDGDDAAAAATPAIAPGQRPPQSPADLDEAAARNQRLMRADPLEQMLRSMGYRLVPAGGDGASDDDADEDGGGRFGGAEQGCRTS